MPYFVCIGVGSGVGMLEGSIDRSGVGEALKSSGDFFFAGEGETREGAFVVSMPVLSGLVQAFIDSIWMINVTISSNSTIMVITNILLVIS